MKKMLLIIMAVCMIATLGIATAHAGWYHTNVIGTGTSGTSAWIVLTDAAATPMFVKRTFILDPANANAMLATALTAASSGLKVYVGFAGAAVPVTNATVLGCYLDNGM